MGVRIWLAVMLAMVFAQGPRIETINNTIVMSSASLVLQHPANRTDTLDVKALVALIPTLVRSLADLQSALAEQNLIASSHTQRIAELNARLSALNASVGCCKSFLT